MAADEEFRQALAAVSAALTELAIPSMIIGGVAVIAAGVPWQTIDIDATLLGKTSDLEKVLAGFARHRIVSRISDAIAFARERQVLLLRHEPRASLSRSRLRGYPLKKKHWSERTRSIFRDFALNAPKAHAYSPCGAVSPGPLLPV